MATFIIGTVVWWGAVDVGGCGWGERRFLVSRNSSTFPSGRI